MLQHKKYDRYELYNDIALLILDGELVYTSSVQPVPALSSSSFDAKVINSSNCVITGWGIFNDGRYYSCNSMITGWGIFNDGR